jgi:hypothetical protein
MLECQHFLRRARTTPHSSHLPQTRNTLKHSVTAKKIYRNSQFESEFLGLPSQGLLTLTWVTWVTLVTCGYPGLPGLPGYQVTRYQGYQGYHARSAQMHLPRK